MSQFPIELLCFLLFLFLLICQFYEGQIFVLHENDVTGDGVTIVTLTKDAKPSNQAYFRNIH